jgi:hypothetical protein
MTFNDIVNQVIVDTARPDMGPSVAGGTYTGGVFPGGGDDRIPMRVASATLALHSFEGNFFYKDIVTSLVKFETTAFIQTLDVAALPRYRSLSYIRKWDPTLAAYQQNPLLIPPLYDSNGYLVSPTTLGLLEVLTNPNDIFDDYHAEKVDVCYQVGNTIMIKSGSSINQALIGYYAYPNLDWSRGNYDSWIAREYGQAVVDTAVSFIFSAIGKQEQARKYDDPRTGLVPMWQRTIKNGNIQPQGS